MHPLFYLVGQPFPDERYINVEFGAVIDFKDTTFDLNIFIDGPSSAEIAAIQSGAFTYGLFDKDNIPILTLEFNGLLFDCSFNILKLNEADCEKWLASRDNAMNIFVVDSYNYQLMAIRSVGLHLTFIDELKKTLAAQKSHFQHMHAVDHHIRRITQQHSLTDLNRLSKKFRIG
ncbi:hypothetical protein [Chitinophaga sp. YIM B06452]|uniref:hypothetical protein n=1 Tax=Chitinophaga sp. YIM B06452 TaxID=3082158 RepID=UPI0031FE479A